MQAPVVHRMMLWLLYIFASTSCQGAWVDDTCKCEKNVTQGTAQLFTGNSLWSVCTSWDESSEFGPGCYSGRQQRKIRCIYNKTKESQGSKYGKKIRSTQCTQYRRCMVKGRACDGYWGHWSNNGRCDCTTNLRTQSRYCYKKGSKSTDGDQPVLSIHCIGSNGFYENNRTVKCTSTTTCPKQTRQTRKPDRYEFTTTKSVKLTTQDNVLHVSVTANHTTEKTVTEETVRPSTMNTITLASVAVAIALLAIVILGVAFFVRRRKKVTDGHSNSHQNTTLMESHYTTNGLYGPSTADYSYGNTMEKKEPGHTKSSTSAYQVPLGLPERNDPRIFSSYRNNNGAQHSLRHDSHEQVPSRSTAATPEIPPPISSESDAYLIPTENSDDEEAIYCNIADDRSAMHLPELPIVTEHNRGTQ